MRNKQYKLLPGNSGADAEDVSMIIIVYGSIFNHRGRLLYIPRIKSESYN
jgi:hypothetical protein